MAKSNGFKWYPRQPTKMIRGVAGMGAAMIGCYNVILDLIYEDKGSCRTIPPSSVASWASHPGRPARS